MSPEEPTSPDRLRPQVSSGRRMLIAQVAVMMVGIVMVALLAHSESERRARLRRIHVWTRDDDGIPYIIAEDVVIQDGPEPAVGLYWYASFDPTTGAGMAAPLNQLLVRTDMPSIYYKSGVANTAWTQIGISGGGSGVAVTGGCGSGNVCYGNGPTSITGSATFTTDGSGDVDVNSITVNTGQLFPAGNAIEFATFGGGGNIFVGGGGSQFLGSSCCGYASNTAVGYNALDLCVDCYGNTAVGYNALGSDIGGSGDEFGSNVAITSTAVGYGSLGNATASVDNTCMGYLSCEFVSTGRENTIVGVETAGTCTTCTDNAVYGNGAGNGITSGSENTCLGPEAGCGSGSAQYNVSVGFEAGGGIGFGSSNVAIGVFSMNGSGAPSVDTSVADTCVGDSSCIQMRSGSFNAGIGDFALATVQTGNEDSALGDHACGLAANGLSNDTCVGAFSLEGDTGGFNVGIGYNAGAGITGGVGNTVVGYDTVDTGIGTGNFNTVIGAEINTLGTISNALILGAGGGGAGAVLLYQTVTMIIDGRNAPSVNNGTLATGSTNAAGRVTGVGSNNTTITFGASLTFSHDDICHAQGEGSASFGIGFSWTPSTTAPTVSCWTTSNGSAATCPSFRYWCPGF